MECSSPESPCASGPSTPSPPQPFKGNPACVVEPFDAWPDAAWMQALAAENNQAETAFLLTTDDPARFGLRWFTPALEVPLCGHATLASGHVLLRRTRR